MWRSLFGRFRKDKCDRTKGMLSAYIDQCLSLREQQEVEQHLKVCQKCQEELDSLRATVELLHRVPQASPSRSFAIAEAKPVPRRTAVWALRAATVAACVMAVFLALAFAGDMMNLFEVTPSMLGEGGEKAAQLEPGEGQNITIDLDTIDIDRQIIEIGEDRYSVTGRHEESDWAVTPSANGEDGERIVIDIAPIDTDQPGGKNETVDSAVKYAITATISPRSLEEPEVIDIDPPVIEVGEESFSVTGSYEEPDPLTDQGESGGKIILNIEPTAEGEPGLPSGEDLGAEEAGWLRPLEYSLIGMVVLLGGAAIAIWRRPRPEEVRGEIHR